MKDNQDNLKTLRHSAEHILTQAVLKLFPKVKMAMGPATDEGFYFDFDPNGENISEKDFPKIEAEMKKIIAKDLPITKKEISKEEAEKLFQKNEYKTEWIKEAVKRGEKLTIYQTGNEFTDLCAGPHLDSTKKIGAFKLLSIAGAYWRGNEKNKMLTRIYGTAFKTRKELNNYLKKLEEAKKRDHRKLGKELGLFLFSDLVGPGLVLYKPKGAVIVSEIEKFMRELQTETDYSHVYTPNIAKADLFAKSGHLQWFRESMYPKMDFGEEGSYYAKPMNCPFHIEIFKSEPRSYKDLPIRYAEFGTVYRYEKSGEINGLLRTRGFTQDDAHIFCREDQVIDEFLNVFKLTHTLLTGLGLTNYRYRLSLRGKEKKKYAGNDKQWEKATQLIREALKKAKIDFTEAPGEAAFYGPKLDIIFTDSLDRDWQISTIQVDFLLPERFDLSYTNAEGKKEKPYMIHRAPLGSRERIMAILTEHYLGNFPLWLSPVQAKILPITERNTDYAGDILTKLKEANIRAEIDARQETLGAKIRDAQLEKAAYILIIGDKEEKEKTISVRKRNGKDLGSKNPEEFIGEIKEEIEKKIISKD